MILNITTSKDNTNLILRPADFDIAEFRKRGIGFYVKNINNGYLNDNGIVIPINNADINVIYSKIKKLFVYRLKCELVSDQSSSTIINKAEQEAEKFSEFSRKALLIRNNNNVDRELEAFTNVLKTKQFKRILKPHQLLSAYHLAFSQNACNFSVPGSGKTTTVLAAYEYLRYTDNNQKKVNKLLVVCPLAAFISWGAEFEKCYGRSPKVLEIMGGVSIKKIEDSLLRSNVEEDIILASYGSIDGKREIIKHFLKNNDVMVVLDEAHRIKNVEEGIQSYAALSLSTDAKSRVVLTGTPAPNSYVDLYNLYKFIWPANNVIGYSTTQLATMSKIKNDGRIPDLINRITPFFIRVKKSDLELPDPIFNSPNSIPMSKIQQIIYDAISEMAIKSFEDNNISNIFKKSALIRMRQAATNPNLLNKPLDDYYGSLSEDTFFIAEQEIPLENTINVADSILDLIRKYAILETPNKFIAAKELAQRIIDNGGKLLIWCEFIGTCQNLSAYLEDNNIKNKILYGATSQDDRRNIIEEFRKEESEFNIIVANPHAVGESISLHEACHNALYLEQGYNAGTYMQSKDRIHRVGLKDADKTNYYFFHSANTVDGTIYERVFDKEKRMLEIMEKEEIPLLVNNADYMEDTEDDIKAIIRAYYEYRKQNI
jgi:SNF2 family DNA or RNA helicase